MQPPLCSSCSEGVLGSGLLPKLGLVNPGCGAARGGAALCPQWDMTARGLRGGGDTGVYGEGKGEGPQCHTALLMGGRG